MVLKSRLGLEGRTFITIILNEGAQEKQKWCRLQGDEVRNRASYVPNNSMQVTEFCLRDNVIVTIGRMCRWNKEEKWIQKSDSSVSKKDLEQNETGINRLQLRGHGESQY